MTTISQSEIENFPVPIPTIEHQKEIVQLFSNLFSLKGLYKSHIKNVSKLSSEYISKALKVN